jgi:GNAT superfamily N-acetyltransferase
MTARKAMGTITVRAARIADAAQIARLSAQLGYPESDEVFAARLRQLLPLPQHAVLVAADAGVALLGFIALEHRLTLESGERTEIVGLVVDADVRRRGLGHALLAAAEEWARGIGKTELMVRSNVVRTESHPFYEGAGYRRAKTQHVYRKTL